MSSYYDSDSDGEHFLPCHCPPRRITPPPENVVYQMQRQRYEVFKEQDYINGNFDLTFDFNGKHLYVHKFVIMPVSDTLNSMCSVRWLRDEKVIKVDNYTYDDFFQFISYLYSGECTLTKENIFALTDIAEFYAVTSFKTRCDIFLSKMTYDLEGIYDMMVFGQRYSLPSFNEALNNFFLRHFYDMINAEKFLTLDKSVVEILAAFDKPSSFFEEEFFEAVCKWAKQQAMSKLPDAEDSVVQEAMKGELATILPHIRFSRMRLPFVSRFVVEHKSLFSASKLYMLLCDSVRMFGFQEQELFQKICELAEENVREKMRNDDTIVFIEAMKMELEEVIPRIKFTLMDFMFLRESLEDKQFLFSSAELCRIYSKSERTIHEECEIFEKVYELAENRAHELQNLSSDRNFDLNKAIKNEMYGVLKNFRYPFMSLEFVLSFIAPKRFLFTSHKFYKIMLGARKNDKEEETCFDAIYEFIEADAKKQLSAADQDLRLNDVIRTEFSSVSHRFKFYRMTLDFMIDNIVKEKSFLFAPFVLYKHLLSAKRDPESEKSSEQEEKFFRTIFELAEKTSNERQQTNPVENFDLKAAIKQELAQIIPNVKFPEMRPEFLVDFVVRNGFTFSAEELYKIFQKFRSRYGNEEELFEAIYQLAEAQANEKISSDGNLNLVDTIKADLAITLPNVQFYKMSKTFLTEVVVKSGCLSEDEAEHVFDYRLAVENSGKTLTGAFVDIFGIKDAIGPNGYGLRVLSYNKQRFTRLKFTVPTTPSAIQKMKGVDWYLILEKDGTLALVSYYRMTRSDYIIAEMRSQDEFTVSKGSYTFLKSYFKDAADD